MAPHPALSTNRRWADPKCPMSNEQCAMCNMCRLLNDLDFPLLIAHFGRPVQAFNARNASGLLPLPAPPSRRSGALARREGGRNEWGEGWGEGNPNKNGPPLHEPAVGGPQ